MFFVTVSVDTFCASCALMLCPFVGWCDTLFFVLFSLPSKVNVTLLRPGFIFRRSLLRVFVSDAEAIGVVLVMVVLFLFGGTGVFVSLEASPVVHSRVKGGKTLLDVSVTFGASEERLASSR